MEKGGGVAWLGLANSLTASNKTGKKKKIAFLKKKGVGEENGDTEKGKRKRRKGKGRLH